MLRLLLTSMAQVYPRGGRVTHFLFPGSTTRMLLIVDDPDAAIGLTVPRHDRAPARRRGHGRWPT
jgi:hypothetical protein